jgi:hypothetical protein
MSDQQKEELTNIQLLIDSSGYYLTSIDSVFAIGATNNFNSNIHYIKNDMVDTLDNETMLFIDKYYGLRKGFRKLGEKYLGTMAEYKISREQVKNLKHDINNGLVEPNQLDQYLELEKKNIELVFESSKTIAKLNKNLVPLYEKMNPKIDSLIEASKAKLKQ